MFAVDGNGFNLMLNKLSCNQLDEGLISLIYGVNLKLAFTWIDFESKEMGLK